MGGKATSNQVVIFAVCACIRLLLCGLRSAVVDEVSKIALAALPLFSLQADVSIKIFMAEQVDSQG